MGTLKGKEIRNHWNDCSKKTNHPTHKIDGKSIINEYEIKRFFNRLNTLCTLGEQRDYSFLLYKTLK